MLCQLNPINKSKINVGRKRGEKDRFTLEVSLIETSDRLTEQYLGRYKGVKSERLNTTRFDKNSDLSMIDLLKINMIRYHKMVAEENFSMSDQGYTIGKLLHGIKCQILLDTGASK